MGNEENKKIVINGKQYYDLKETPEPFREMVKAKMEAVKAGKEASGASKIVIHKDFRFQAEPGLIMLLKWLVKISPPPKPRQPQPADAAAPPAEPETRPHATPGLPQPGAIQPSSSGRAILLILIILAAVYFFYRTALK